MKYRITELNNGIFEVHSKRSFFNRWFCEDGFETLEQARGFIADEIAIRKRNDHILCGMKPKRVVEVIKE